jgi:hypothetical protein
MLRKSLLFSTIALFGLGSAAAHADHDRHLRYVVGGALIGAAFGELAYSSRRHSHAHVVVPPSYAAMPAHSVRKPPKRGRGRGRGPATVVYHTPAPVYFVPPGHRHYVVSPRHHRRPSQVVYTYVY